MGTVLLVVVLVIAYLQTCHGEALLGVVNIAQQPTPSVHTTAFYTVFALKDYFFLHVQKEPVPFFYVMLR